MSQISFFKDDGTVSFGEKLAGSEQFLVLFKEGMDLVGEAAAYLDGDGREEARGLARAAALGYAVESMRLTTRLMQIASWLLLQRAVNEGELTRAEAAAEKRRISRNQGGSAVQRRRAGAAAGATPRAHRPLAPPSGAHHPSGWSALSIARGARQGGSCREPGRKPDRAAARGVRIEADELGRDVSGSRPDRPARLSLNPGRAPGRRRSRDRPEQGPAAWGRETKSAAASEPPIESAETPISCRKTNCRSGS